MWFHPLPSSWLSAMNPDRKKLGLPCHGSRFVDYKGNPSQQPGSRRICVMIKARFYGSSVSYFELVSQTAKRPIPVALIPAIHIDRGAAVFPLHFESLQTRKLRRQNILSGSFSVAKAPHRSALAGNNIFRAGLSPVFVKP